MLSAAARVHSSVGGGGYKKVKKKISKRIIPNNVTFIIYYHTGLGLYAGGVCIILCSLRQ